jgi:hypothetical protein
MGRCDPPDESERRIDGDRVAYRVGGKGLLVLRVHGMADRSLTWIHAMPAPAPGPRVA